MPTSTCLVSLFLAVALAMVTASAPMAVQESETPSDTDTQRLLEEGVALYSGNAEGLDISFARSLIAGRTVNVHVEDGGKTRVLSTLVRDDTRVEGLSTGPDSETSTRVTTDQKTLETIAGSPKPMSEVQGTLSDGCIRVNGERGHPVDQVVWTVIDTFKSFSL